MAKPLRALFVEDSEDDLLLVVRELRLGGFDVTWERIDTREAMAAALARGGWDLIISDFRMPQFSATEAVALYRELGLETPFILVSGTVGERQAVDALKAGAHDFFLKSELTLLPTAVERELREAESRRTRRAAEAAIASEKAFSEAMLESLPGIFYLFDRAGRFLRWSRSFEAVTGYSAEELKAMTPFDLVEGETRALAEVGIRRVFESGSSEVESVLVSKDGRRTPYLFFSRVFFGGAGPCCIGIGIDVSERKNMEAELRQAQKMEAIGQLAGGVAHDFNNILGVILGYGELTESMLAPGSPAHEQVTEIIKAARRAAGLTSQLQAFSRKQVLQPKRLDLNDLVANAHKMLERVLGEDLTLVVRAAPALGTVLADPGQIDQILLNLAINARDAMPKGGTLTLETTDVDLRANDSITDRPAIRPGRYVMLAVSDTGVGMDAETQRRIFEPFFTTKPVGQGTGLGLATVYGIVKQSEGYIWVYSEPGLGTTFKIYLPRVDELPDDERSDATMEKTPGGNETILLVEDNPALREVTRRQLAASGYTVLLAVDGEAAEALAGAHVGTIDLLLTDVVMPQLGGGELARRLGALRPRIRVLFMSGYTDGALAQHGVLEEGVALLEKPFSGEQLLRAVRDMLDRSPRSEEAGRL